MVISENDAVKNWRPRVDESKTHRVSRAEAEAFEAELERQRRDRKRAADDAAQQAVWTSTYLDPIIIGSESTYSDSSYSSCDTSPVSVDCS